jgi:hypothetical protein
MYPHLGKNYYYLSNQHEVKNGNILSIPYAQWKKRGFSKGTLHYMKKNAESDKPFTLNKHVRERLNKWDASLKVSIG